MLHSVSTQSKMSFNTHIFFCREANCERETHQYDGLCKECAPCCEFCHEVFDSEHSPWLPSESGHFCGKWCEAGWLNEQDCHDEHICNGEMDYDRGYKICDDRDDPRCPSYRQRHSSISTEPVCDCRGCKLKIAADEMTGIGVGLYGHCTGCFKDFPLINTTVCRKMCWSCQQLTRTCADCGSPPKKGHFSCYRGNDPLCHDCDANANGPQSPVDWRESYGRCSKCDLYYALICSSDRRDLCRWC